jgi:hypothetical protein
VPDQALRYSVQWSAGIQCDFWSCHGWESIVRCSGLGWLGALRTRGHCDFVSPEPSRPWEWQNGSASYLLSSRSG